MKTAYFLTATFPRKPPHFFASGHNTISKFTCTSARVLAHSHLEPGNARRGKPKAKAEAAFERKRNCIQPSKPTDRLYKSQAADGLAFLHYFA